MPKQNPYLIPNENYRKTETVQALKDKYKVPSYEEFMKTYEPSEESELLTEAEYQDRLLHGSQYGPGNEQSTVAAVVAGTVVGGVAIVATGGMATPLVVAGARAAEGAYHAQNHLEVRHLAALGLVGTGVLALGNGGDSRNSQNSSSPSSSFTLERKTVWDWWCNGLTGEEREILLEHGYSDRSGCFSLEELKSTSERMFAEKAPGKPTEKDGFKPDKKQGDKLVKNPNGKGKGWLDKNGEVWVPTGKGGDNPEGRPHGGPHWDVQNRRTGGHRNVYKGGGTR